MFKAINKPLAICFAENFKHCQTSLQMPLMCSISVHLLQEIWEHCCVAQQLNRHSGRFSTPTDITSPTTHTTHSHLSFTFGAISLLFGCSSEQLMTELCMISLAVILKVLFVPVHIYFHTFALETNAYIITYRQPL